MKDKCLRVLKIVVVIVLMISCLPGAGIAANPGRYSIDMQYDAADAVIPEQIKAEPKMRGAVISVWEFSDIRQVADKKTIGWVKELDGTNVPVFPKSDIPARMVASGVKAYLKKAGYKVADPIGPWDLNEGTLPKGMGGLIVGGSIEEMDFTCWTGVFSNDYKAGIKLNLVLADAVKGKILHKSNVSIAFSRTDVSFSEGQMGGEAGKALGEAIEKVLEGKTTAQKIKEAVSPARKN